MQKKKRKEKWCDMRASWSSHCKLQGEGKKLEIKLFGSCSWMRSTDNNKYGYVQR